MHGHIYKIRLSDGLTGRRQAMAYQRIYNAQIVQRNDSYMAVVDVKDEETSKRLENFINYIHRIKPIKEKGS